MTALGKGFKAEGSIGADWYVTRLLQRVFTKASETARKDDPERKETPTFNKNYDKLIGSIDDAVKTEGAMDRAESRIRQSFSQFLKDQGYAFAAKNFEKLLEEKSGERFTRNDGTVNWFHELVPIVTVMALVRNGSIPMKAMNQYGGLETAITSHLRHDSVEDHFDDTSDELLAFRQELKDMLRAIVEEDPDYNQDKGEMMIEQTIVNTRLISQKKFTDTVTGAKFKEDVLGYTERMIGSKHANPVVFMLKQADGVHNFATLWAPKFTAERRQKRCDEREDMYGARYGFTDAAVSQWPAFAKGIKVMDDMMGMMLYTHFRYLESVDKHYKKENPHPVGIARYLDGAMSIDLPKPVNMVHIFMDNLVHSVDREADHEKHKRLQRFIELNVKGGFKGHEKELQQFEYLLGKSDNKGGDAPAPVAF